MVVPDLGDYLPQIRHRSANQGFLDEGIYGVRGEEVLRREVVSAAALREGVGLQAGRRLVLILFGDDVALERWWDDRERLIPAIARAGYDLVVPPSYSAYVPRPRPDFMYSAKRSLWFYAALQQVGVPAIPRVVWLREHDARRIAAWLNANPVVEWVAIDWMTLKNGIPRSDLEGLALVDELTGHRLRYLVNGPASPGPCLDVCLAVSPDRVCITNGTFGPPPSENIRRLGPLTPAARGSEFRRVAAERRTIVEQAKAEARATRGLAEAA